VANLIGCTPHVHFVCQVVPRPHHVSLD
jgi:hypothetical protein